MVIGTVANAFADAPGIDAESVRSDSVESDGFSDAEPPRTAPLVGAQGSVSTVWNARPSALGASRGFLPSLSQSQGLLASQLTPERTLGCK